MQKIYKIICLLILSSAVASHAAADATDEKRVALVIGNSHYQHTPTLINPQNDATAVGNSLIKLGFDTDVKLNLAKTEMDQVFRQFSSRLTGANIAVFFYAGHGIQVNGINYLVPVDAALRNEIDLAFEVCDLGLVLRVMENSQRLNVLFLDACRDNPLSEKLARSIGTGRSAAIGRGLAPVKANAGTLISYATRDGEIASDGKDNNSPYTKALLKYLEQPGLEIHQLLRNVRNDVRETTKGKQTPWEYGSLLNEFYFLGPVTLEVRPQEDTSQKVQTELIYWQSIMNDSNPAVFDLYLKKYPNGIYADLARIKIETLTKAEKPVPEPVKTPVPKGGISIVSEPSGASVLMDGKLVGQTNLKIGELDAGSKIIEIQRECYRSEKKELTVSAGREVEWQVSLTPVCGTLFVESDPVGADVWIEGRNMGRTPLTMGNMPEGDYAAGIDLAGYQKKQVSVRVRAVKDILPEKIVLDKIVLPMLTPTPTIPLKPRTSPATGGLSSSDKQDEMKTSAVQSDKEALPKQHAAETDSASFLLAGGKNSLLILPFEYVDDARVIDHRIANITNRVVKKSGCFQLTHSYLSKSGQDDAFTALNAQEISIPLWSAGNKMDSDLPMEIGKKYQVDFVLGGFVDAAASRKSTFEGMTVKRISLILVNAKTGRRLQAESTSGISGVEDELENLLKKLMITACQSK